MLHRQQKVPVAALANVYMLVVDRIESTHGANIDADAFITRLFFGAFVNIILRHRKGAGDERRH